MRSTKARPEGAPPKRKKEKGDKEMKVKELREKIERLEKENKYLEEMAEKMRHEKNRLYNNNIRLVQEIKELTAGV
jgi:predicted nuclease with TOPRIM domain